MTSSSLDTSRLVSRCEERESMRTSHKTGLGGHRDPRSTASVPITNLALGWCRDSGAQVLHTLSKSPPSSPSPGRALLPPPHRSRARRPRPGTPGAWGLVLALPGPEHAPERPRAQPTARWFLEPPGRRSPARRSLSAIFPQPGPAAPHLPPPRTPKPLAAIFEQGTPPGPVVPGAVTRWSGPCRPPSCSRRHVCVGLGPPCPHREGTGVRGG